MTIPFSLFFCSHLLSLGRKWCRTSCNSLLPHCCLSQVFIAQYTTKMRGQNLEFPQLSVEIAFCSWGSSLWRFVDVKLELGCKVIYKELLIPPQNR